MKKLLLYSIAVSFPFLFAACAGNTEEASANTITAETETAPVATITDNTPTQGKGMVTLVCKGQTFVNAGNCNYSSAADAIVVADSANNKNVFTINLDGGLPTETRTYKLLNGLSGKEYAGMSFVRFPAEGKMIDWDTDKNSGSLTLNVEGNKISCSFSNIPLAPAIMYNPDALNATGMCSGSFTLYK